MWRMRHGYSMKVMLKRRQFVILITRHPRVDTTEDGKRKGLPNSFMKNKKNTRKFNTDFSYLKHETQEVELLYFQRLNYRRQ